MWQLNRRDVLEELPREAAEVQAEREAEELQAEEQEVVWFQRVCLRIREETFTTYRNKDRHD